MSNMQTVLIGRAVRAGAVILLALVAPAFLPFDAMGLDAGTSLAATEPESAPVKDIFPYFLWGTLALLVAGIWLGLRGTVTVYRNLADMGLTFGVLVVPFVALFGDDARWGIGVLIVELALLIAVMVRTWQDNRSIWKWALALATKIPLALLFVFAGISALAVKQVDANTQNGAQNAGTERAVAFAVLLGLGALIYKLIRDKPVAKR